MYANAYGNESNDKTKTQMQLYHNFQLTWNILNNLDIVTQIDFCSQTNSKISDTTATAWLFAGFAMLRYKLFNNLSITYRHELADDPEGFISSQLYSHVPRLKLWTSTLGVQYSPFENIYFRSEYQYMKSDSRIFDRDALEKQSILFTAGLRF